MKTLRQIPLGHPVPESVHAVCCSLPTMADVIGYEEKKPETMEAVRFAYPRFVFHEYVVRAANLAAERHGIDGRAVYAVASAAAAWSLAEYVGSKGHAILPEADFVLIHFADTLEIRQRAKAFLQHTGASITSRQAEDYLVSSDSNIEFQPEVRFDGDAEKYVLGGLRQYLDTPYLWLSNCGMNAFYAAIHAVRSVQRPKGRKIYLQLGWLYLDTQRILEKLLGEGDRLIVQLDVFDEKALQETFEQYGQEIAAVVTELPTNPQLETSNISLLSKLCQKYGVVRVIDPSVAGVVNVDVLPYSDVVVTSLTKYAAWEGDVMMGCLAVNQGSLFADQLCSHIGRQLEPPYIRDLSRLAHQIAEMPVIAARVNANTARVCDYLESHPSIRRVLHAREARSAKNFELIARSEASVGSLLTIELNKPLANFYDLSTVVKGPSFGTHFTMMCPFMYLAHYDLISNAEGQEYLKSVGIDPNLVRISIGAEPFSEIREALAAGLDD